MKIESPAFIDGDRIPQKYTCDGDRLLSPALTISEVPEAAKSLVLIVDDPDVPKELRADGNFTHWVVFNIPPETTEIPEGAKIGTVGANTRGDAQYTGPCPPPEYEPKTHRYFFKLYALDVMLDLQSGATKKEIEGSTQDHIIESAQLIGTYSRV